LSFSLKCELCPKLAVDWFDYTPLQKGSAPRISGQK
jgi:hypothetical protein